VTGSGSANRKTKTPRIHRSKRGGIGTELWWSLCLLYPKRSITSHRFCGSGRLFPGLRSEARRAEIDITGAAVTESVSNSGREQAYLGNIPLSREFCKICTNRPTFMQSNPAVRSKKAKRVRNGRVSALTSELGGRRAEAEEGRSREARWAPGLVRRFRRGECRRLRVRDQLAATSVECIGRAVRAFDQASVAPKRIPRLDQSRDAFEAERNDKLLTDLSNLSYAHERLTFTFAQRDS
jgi:hypothetical protein